MNKVFLNTIIFLVIVSLTSCSDKEYPVNNSSYSSTDKQVGCEIQSGATMEIDPGASVEVEEGGNLAIKGKLVAPKGSSIKVKEGATMDLTSTDSDGADDEDMDSVPKIGGCLQASGKNANIVASNTDLAITLTDNEIAIANELFYVNKRKAILKKNPSLTSLQALNEARRVKTVPERYYREQMRETQGILIIYLFDTNYVFHQKGPNSENAELKNTFGDYINQQNINLTMPLVAYAMGFPPLANNPGGEYMQGDYDLNLDEGEDEEEDDTDILDDYNN